MKTSYPISLVVIKKSGLVFVNLYFENSVVASKNIKMFIKCENNKKHDDQHSSNFGCNIILQTLSKFGLILLIKIL